MYSVRVGALLPVFLFGVVCADIPAERNQSLHYEAQLHKDLLSSYNSDYRPVKNHKSTVTVRVRFTARYFSYDASEDILTVRSWMTMSWKDEFLYWNKEDYGGLMMVILHSHEIWIPRLVLYNSDAAMNPADRFDTLCFADYSGNVTCVPSMAHNAICRTSLRRWPYDIQNCTLKFGAWAHNGEQVNFTFYETYPLDTSEVQSGAGWKLLRVVNERSDDKYSCCPNDTYPSLQYTFVLKREAAGPAAIVVIPSIVIVTITLTSVMLDVKDNVRLTLVCFSLFDHFIYLMEIGYNIPKHGTETPIILQFIRDSMLLTLTALLVTLLLKSITKRDHPAPRWIITIGQLVTRGPGKYLIFMKFDPGDDTKMKLTEDDFDDNANEERRRAANEWMQFANILNSFTFIIMFFVYFVLICAYIPYDD